VEETGSDTERIKTRHRSRSPHAQIIRTTRFEDRSAHNSGVSKDGRFLLPVQTEPTTSVPITVVINWVAALKK
ncbi:MAG: hypothetical protein ABSB35_36680, partial [Bryobacteraceae bacterium]|jgi:hypothetical protein